MFRILNTKTIAFVIALLLLSGLTACKKEAPQEQALEETPFTGHILSGSTASPVRIEVFSDMQCPACRELFIGIIRPVIKEYQDKVCVIYHEFPLSGHQYARPAARYVAAAAKLGQRQALSVYEAIFNDQVFWGVDGSLEKSVSKALSGEDFTKAMQILRDANSLAQINETIEKELQLGMRKGVNSTPTMFVSYSGKEEKLDRRPPSFQIMKQFLDPLVK
ncbi:MAG: DsbA family protein [Acidobacteriota bacterium]|jgi:protein-disulfide isomerase|nr:DsbA family protein [Acidobacteriota bacterium]